MASTTPSTTPSCYFFGGFTLDLARFALLGPDGRAIELRRQGFDTLLLLARNAGVVVTKERLIEEIWGGRKPGSDEQVQQCISAVRKALGKKSDLVKTVPTRGYRLEASVTTSIGNRAELLPVEAPTPSDGLLAAAAERVVPKEPGAQSPAVSRAPPAGDAGTPAWPTVAGGERRTVTVLVASLGDLASSPHDPEDFQDVLGAVMRCVQRAVEKERGFLVGGGADQLIGCFGYPGAREEDAERAVLAALAAKVELASPSLTRTGATGSSPLAADGLQARFGVATGLVVVAGGGDGTGASFQLTGEALHKAARLCSLASPGSIAVCPRTRRQVGDLFEFRDPSPAEQSRGLLASEASIAQRESTVASRFYALQRSSGAPLVGRVSELDTLLRLWQHAAAGEGRVVHIVGEGGIGKSRLVQGLLDRLEGKDYARIQYFCSPVHTDSALYPVIRHLEEAASIERADDQAQRLAKLETLLRSIRQPLVETVPVLAPLLSIKPGPSYPPPAASPQRRKQRTYDTLLQQIIDIAARKPVLMVIEDAHWIDPTSLDLTSLLAERIESLRVLMVITARPEFEAPWPMHSHIASLHLSRLGPRESEVLAQGIVKGRRLPPELLGEIKRRTDGVPLFVEELTKSVLESGALKQEGDQYVLTAPLPEVAIPATLHASLIARLDRLREVKWVAQVAAVIGREFSYALIAAVAGRPEPELRAGLDALMAAGIVFRRGSPPDATYYFKHPLLREAAYDSLLRGHRRELHGKIVGLLAANAADEPAPELMAYHAAQAEQAEAAARYYFQAGERSVARSAMSEAAALCAKALYQVEKLPEGAGRDMLELEIRAQHGAALIGVRGYSADETGATFRRARELWTRLGQPRAYIKVARGLWLFYIVRAQLDRAEPIAQSVLTKSRAEGYIEGELLAAHCIGAIHVLRGELAKGRSGIEEALKLHAAQSERNVFEAAYDPTMLGLVLLALTLSLLGDHDAALARAAKALERARASGQAPDIAASLSIAAKMPTASEQNLAEWLAQLDVLVDQHGYPYWAASAQIIRGQLALGRGDPATALTLLRQGIDGHFASGAAMWSGHLASLLSLALERTGDVTEALRVIDEHIGAAETSGEKWSLAEMHRRRGCLLLAGRPKADDAAEKAFETAIAIAREQSARTWELRAATDLARLRLERRRAREARDVLAPIVAWFAHGPVTSDLAAAKALLADLERK